MAKRKIEIVLLIEKANDIPLFEESNVKVITLKNKKGLKRFFELYKVVSQLNREGYLRTYIRIASLTAIVSSIASKLNGGKTFFWQSGTTIEWDLEQPLNMKKLKWYITSYIPGRIARKCVDYFVTGPESMVDYYERVAGVDRSKIKLLYNDIDISRFSFNLDEKKNFKSNFLSEKGYTSDTRIILLVHRLSPVRRTTLYFPYCLEYLKKNNQLNKVVMIVAGGGSELTLIKQQTELLGVDSSCVFLGDVANSEIQALYNISDIFIHPTYNEGFPRVILEAMAAGLPIVSTDAGGTVELVGVEQQKYISSKDNIMKFCENLLELLNDNNKRAELTIENRDWVEKFSTVNIARMYEKVLFDE